MLGESCLAHPARMYMHIFLPSCAHCMRILACMLLTCVATIAYAEVGRLANATEDRTHFGAWAIISAPLILGFDMTNSAILERAWPTVTNHEVITVSQTWAGLAGRRLVTNLDYQVSSYLLSPTS